MKKIEAVIRPERLNHVKAALQEVGVSGMTVMDVHGRGEQKGFEFINRAGKYRVDLLPKTLIEVVVHDEDVDRVVDAIVRCARTGEIGDGKVFVTSVERCVRIRTGEEDDAAL
ncbi:MAG TPA: P-II family nitrogen regulator [Methanomassiliicoccaceae archaeon]|jgi:nitrogen regulatory protein P-II 1|nr:P-II family nitrogen regulator [Euryarchaeota archaeon]HOB37568.1 P-II family nitrogen regulator [Methanomassiliicoccaceae archaeon]HOQ26571.1 P-II family nitrogen regulator [Methanomassiliicoccaceae archaeon]HPP44293.1 P-II family nitrogen regulator [Methanomassiliicoccaceae archaeon]HPT73621.1 P-II family nitrogen regulator [Methanomassiliicoccaceae archaeon]